MDTNSKVVEISCLRGKKMPHVDPARFTRISRPRRKHIVDAFENGRSLQWLTREYKAVGLTKTHHEDCLRAEFDELRGQVRNLEDQLRRANSVRTMASGFGGGLLRAA